MLLLLVALAGAALAAGTYLGLERLGRRALVPMSCRAVAWAAIGVLLVNVSCPAVALRERPIVLLDASLSLDAKAGQWRAARQLADSLGEPRRFGGVGPDRDPAVPAFGRSSLAASLGAAAASGRPVIIVSDGEIDDLPDVAPDLLAKAGVRVVPRRDGSDVAISAVDAPRRAVRGDTIGIAIDLRAFGALPESTSVTISDRGTVLARRSAAWRDGVARIAVRLPTSTLQPGERLLRVQRVGPPDLEPDTDERLIRLDLAETPGAVLLASPGDWDARFLYRAVRDVAGVPLRGFVRLEPGRWRDMRDLTPVSEADVRLAARNADLLLLKGATADYARTARARGVLTWPSGEGGETLLAGDWYLGEVGASPIAASLVGAPLDSFPPATALVPLQPDPESWVGLSAQEGRRGASRPVIVGRTAGRVRTVTVAADGLFRWSFRGGSSEQAYRSLVGGTIAWLLGGADSLGGAARPVRHVVQRGQPVVFEWRAAGQPMPTPVQLQSAAGALGDTLRFDGAGRAELWLPPGEWRYTLDGGGAGLMAVERFADELMPRARVLVDQSAASSLTPRRTSVRDQLWLFGLALLALAGEWFARRRLGLR